MYKLLYQNHPNYRICRHVIFWVLLFLLDFSSTLIFWYPRYMANREFSILFLTWKFDIPFFLVDVIFSYVVVYRIYPRYIKNKRAGKFILSCGYLLVLAFIVKCVIRYTARSAFDTSAEVIANVTWITFISFLNSGPVVKCLLFLSCKLLKDYYLKTERMILLAQENWNAEMQLLKAQVHPHFLFNTLNNIYSSIITEKSNAADLINRLKNTLTYMITDCQAAEVPLWKEMKMIHDYVELEKIRYGDRLHVNIDTSGNMDNKMIAPLLLIPVVENCFKHGTSLMLEPSWINFHVIVDEAILHITLENSKPSTVNDRKSLKGIGINNVRKRMRLLYKERGLFEAFASPTTFKVAMSIPLNT